MIDFYDYRLTRDNIRFILAFPQSREDQLPILASARLKTKGPKIDLQRVLEAKHDCYFESIDDLKKNFLKRYPRNTESTF